MKDWDLKIFSIYFTGFAIGASFYIQQEKFKLRYFDEDFYNCLNITFGAMGISCHLTIPLFKLE